MNAILAVIVAALKAIFGARPDTLAVQARDAGASGRQVAVDVADAQFVARAQAARERAVTAEQQSLDAADRRAGSGDPGDAGGVRPDVSVDDPFQRD